MGNTITQPKPYDIVHGGEHLSHSYFVKRQQRDLHYAWLLLKHLAQKTGTPVDVHEHLLVKKAHLLYAMVKDTAEFARFCKWMGPIPV